MTFQPTRFATARLLSQHLRPATRRTFTTTPTPFRSYNHHSAGLASQKAYYKRRAAYAAVGAIASVIATVIAVKQAPIEKLDAPPRKSGDPFRGGNPIIEGGGIQMVDGEGTDFVETGSSAVPFFPKTVTLPSKSSPIATEEYQLLGLGIRKVSWLSIPVYVVGIYIPKSDIATLQACLVRQVNPAATALVPNEQDELRSSLLNPVTGPAIWEALLKDTGIRLAIRVAPVRNTDFPHLRDGWTRAIVRRVQRARTDEGPAAEYLDEKFGKSMVEFRQFWGGGSVKKGTPIYMTRDRQGVLEALTVDANGQLEKRGEVEDERLSRILCLSYLGGFKVNSEEVCQNIVNEVVGFTGRPVGAIPI
ncbi:MAG: Altered inheritance of mitochondria protein 18 mitochondrial [Cirrosporium novae-zelandiae]|nr:MAG: Altered inheritance of mitochondria protein 18 mitochondrial [Cirrosporium novae-zelandiae]